MWVVDLTVVHEGVPRSKTCGFYTRAAVVDFFEKLLHKGNVLTINVHYDEKLGKRGDK
jgi:predicted secreted protein